MGFDFTGYVIRPPRSASANAATTGEALSGVDRDHKPIPPAYVLPPTSGGEPEPFADEYRAAVLLRPTASGGTDEYLVWAANTGSLTTLEDPAFARDGDPATDISPQPGSLSVTGGYTDGTATFLVKPAGGRSFSILTELQIKVGGAPFASPITATTFASVDPTTGVVVLDAGTLTALGGGFSLDRGDRFVGIRYVLARARFWWTKNDANQTRFGWNFAAQRWQPYKGSPAQNLGPLVEGSAFRLTPFKARFAIGDFLPGNPLDADEYALVRLGTYPDATSSVPTIEVVSDSDAATPGFTFTGQDAVVGVGSGLIQWNPAYVLANTGQTVWYSPEAYLTNATGALGRLIDANQEPLFLSPLPEATDRPLVRLGYRTYLAPVPYDNDAALPLPLAVSPGTFAWSRTTGKMVFSDVDVLKATPGDPLYEIPYLGTVIYFDGVSLTTQPMTTKDPVRLTDSTGTPTPIALGLDMFVPLSQPLPFPGVSGVRYVPDGTGTIPDLGAGNPTTRVNGNDTGLVRQIVGIGDTIFFLNDTKAPIFTDVDVVEYDVDLPEFDFGVARPRIFVSRQADPSVPGSVLSRTVFKRAGRVGNDIYFLQADVTPAVYADEPRIYSRLQEPFVFLGGENIRFALDGVPVTFTASAGQFTAAQVATALQAAITTATAPGTATAIRGRIVLTANTSTVEIGWNTDETDLSGQAVLGFLPGWRVDTSGIDYRWLPDNGSSLGVFRSPLNLNGSSDVSDFYDTNRIEATLVDSVFSSPTVTVNLPPLVDIPGFAPDVQFRLVRDLSFQNLYNWEDVLYEFDQQRFVWLDEGILSATSVMLPTSPLALGFTGVVPETLNPLAMLDPSFGLYTRDPGATSLSLQTNTYFADGGQSGFVYLGNEVGPEVLQGTAGQFTAGSVDFTDLNVSDWTAVLPTPTPDGYRLAIRSGDAAGSYIIEDIDPLNLAVLRVKADVPFPFSSAPYATWEVYEGEPSTVFDPAIVADRTFLDFSFLAGEPFVVRLLSDIGTTNPATISYPSFLGPALASGRILAARFGYGHTDPEVPITVLRTGLPIGIVKQLGLSVPDVADPFFISNDFQIRLNGVVFSIGGGDLIGAATLPPLIPNPNAVYYGTVGSGFDGQLYLGDNLVTNYAGGSVVFDQVAPAPASIPSGIAFANPNTGDVTLSLVDATTYDGTTLYLVEQLIINVDVSVNPLTGGVYMTLPLRTGQIVEAQYFKATSDGTLATDPVTGNPIEIVEYLSNVVRLETATRIDEFTYSFNPSGRTVDSAYPVTVWVGPRQLNFAGRVEVIVDGNLLRFISSVPASANVRLNYAALQALGGEQSYSISVIPAYRPPFFLTADQTTFAAEGDRTASMQAGTLLVVDTSPYYVRSTTYDAGTNQTTVVLWPPRPYEVGSRSPTNDRPALVSSEPIALTIDPVTPTPGLGSTGFLIAQPSLVYVPINRGDTSVLFVGNQTTLIQANRLLEIGGYPFLVSASELSDDGRFTNVTFSSPSLTGLSLVAGDAVFLSARAIYDPLPSVFVGISPYLNFRPVELVRFGLLAENGTPLPGKTLVPGVDFTSDPTTGGITTTAPLLPGQSLLFRYTAEEVLVGSLVDGAELPAAYQATYRYRTLPSTQNGLVGTSVIASYTYRSPDSFYYEVQTLRSYSAEVTKTVVGRTVSSTAGPSIITSPTAANGAQGSLGYRGQIQDLYAQDRAARVLLLFYNEIVFTFEQTLEAMNGQLIGDRDGKFKFFVGRGLTYPPPGYEDPFSGRLNIRLLWAEVFASLNSQALIPAVTDPLADPTEPITVDPNRPGRVDGFTPNPNMLDYLIEQQLPLVANDMDDRILLGFRNPIVGAITAALLPKVDIFGLFKQLWQNSIYSRLYPEETLAFTQTIPGIDADLATGNKGFYTFARFGVMPSPGIGLPKIQVVRTNRKPIATFTNPVYGDIPNIQDATVRPRLARARIWAYSPTGFSGASGLAATQPCLIATPLDLSVFPIDPNTGLPDTTQLYGNGGNIYSLATGDPDLSTPPFQIGDLLGYGQPNGSAFTLGNQAFPLPPYGGTPSGTNYVGIYVREVVEGCYLVLGTKDAFGVVVAVSPDNIIVVETGNQFTALQGDTIFVAPDVQNPQATTSSDPPTIEESQTLAAAIPNYRRDLDIYINKRASEIRDATFPSVEDPFIPIKEWLGQRPPNPLDTIEADVNFANTDKQPTVIPALLGQPLNDSGDVSIPYLSAYYNEINLLGQAAAKIRAFFGADSAFATPYPLGVAANEQQTWEAIFPDEIVASDGEILAAAGLGVPNEAPSVLYTAQNLAPVSGPYVANSAIGNARPFDLLLMETNQPSMVGFAGATGILSIGDTTSASGGVPNGVEVPRFVTPTPYTVAPAFPPVRPHRYTVENAFGFTVPANPVAGVIITQVVGPSTVTTFDFTSVGGLTLDDGSGVYPPLGGLNWFFQPLTTNVVVLRIYSKITGVLIEEFAFTNANSYGGAAPAGTANVAQPEAGTAVVLTDMVITTDTALPIALSAGSGLYYDFTITVDTYITAATSAATGGTLAVASGTGSETANIGRDRLTYADRYQLSFAQPRGTTTFTGAVNIEASLAVWEIPAGAINDCTVNAPISVNAGLPFTFLSRNDALGLAYVGTFTAASSSGASDEQGTVKVMPWEANGNSPIVPLTGINFSALPSSDLGPSLPILNGTGRVFDSTGGFNRPWLQFVAPAAGSVASVQSGDTVVVDEALSGFGAVKAGTYLVRHAIASNGAASDGTPIRSFATIATGGSDTGWLGLRFPILVAFDQGANTITVDRLTPVYGSPSGYDFPASGIVSVVRNPAYATYDPVVPAYTLNPQSVFRAAYTSFTVNSDDTVTFNLGILYSDALALISASNFFAGLSVGQQTSGMTYLPVGPLDNATNNAVGYGLDNAANILTAGFLDLDIAGQASGYTSTVPANLLASTFMVVGTPVASTAFLPDPRTPVYPSYLVLGGTVGVPSYVDLTAGAVNWDDAHFEGTLATLIDCILPADRLTSTANLLAGVFLEPSFARPVVDLGQAVPHVVAASYTATSANQIGLRNYDSFVGVPQGYEDVHFYVRRVRRWHEQQNQLVDQLNGLKPVYEIRAGTAASYNAATRTLTSATFNFASFLLAAANVQPGDILRILDVNGDLVDTATIEAVLGTSSLRLRRPGLLTPILPGTTYQIYLRNPIVPQLQSNEQLLGLITSEVIVDRRVDYGAGDTDGGFVATSNEMQDTLIPDWNTTGVAVGDYVVIDPAGPLYVTGEVGTRPFGDQSVLSRGPALPYLAGEPSQLDDNRGFYRITALDPAGAYIEVDGSSYFGGSDPSGVDDVTYGSSGNEYAVLPTIHGSTLTGGQEGQQTLRLTAAPPVPAGSYNARVGPNAYKSIEPFPYRIIRPDSTFSQETVDLVLFMRERMLSWTEEIRYAYDNTKGGTYFVFQRDDQINDIGSPTDPTDGLGVLSNAFLVSITGLIDYSPFANVSDCLSILDRRFWIRDYRLDTETPVGGPPPYASLSTGEGRPVLPDLVDAAIEQDNNFRTLRYAWVRFRANKINGTLPTTTLAEEGLEDKLAEQRQALYLQQQLPR